MTAAEQEVNDAMHEGVNILNGVIPVKIEKNDENRAVAMIICTILLFYYFYMIFFIL